MLRKAFVLVLCFLISGCISQGEYQKVSLTMPDGEKATLGTSNNQLPTWAYGVDGYLVPFIVRGDVTPKQLDALGRVGKACREYTSLRHPLDVVTLGTDAIIFGGFGALGGYLGSLAFPYAIGGQYAKYGAATGGAFGAGWGLTTLGGKNYTFQSCAREAFDLFPRYGVRVPISSTYP